MFAREERNLLGNIVKDCFIIENFFLFESISSYVISVGLSKSSNGPFWIGCDFLDISFCVTKFGVRT